MDAHNELIRFKEMFNEAERAKQVWVNEYLKSGRFNQAHVQESNVMADFVSLVLNSLPKDHALRERALAVQNKVHSIRMDVIQPHTKLDPNNAAEAFVNAARNEGYQIAADDRDFRRAQSWFMIGAAYGFDANTAPPAAEPVEYERPAPKRRSLIDDEEPVPPPKRRSLMDD